MTFLRLFFEFFKTGLFAVGGGLATVPFLTDIGNATGWFTNSDLSNMIAVSESTPGPIGINMATYVGFEVGGVPGAVIATLGLITPSIIVILIIAGFLQKFRQNKQVENVFYGLRPASTGLIAAACWSVISISLLRIGQMDGAYLQVGIDWKLCLVALLIFCCTREKHLKGLHPIVWIGVSAVLGIVFSL